MPDSLTNVFYTAAGREVRDGGGVMPDITVKQEKLPNILFYLVRDNLIFDYATQYCLKHPTVVAPEKFVVTDRDDKDFKGKGFKSKGFGDKGGKSFGKGSRYGKSDRKRSNRDFDNED